jgi:bifunctional UDP-N-acetylglucosamine pyrophosphorylase/glucosamine-1-phosphate N-acetyltransferase
MQVVILAAGRGTRMKELTDNVPKPMLEINGKPILAYKLEALPEEIDEVIFIVGYLASQVQEYFGQSYAGKKISYIVQEKLNGSGAAVHLAKDILKNDFLVMNGDDLYLEEDIKNLIDYDIATLGLEVENPRSFGIFVFNEKGKLKEIVEKPDMDGPAFANIGMYKLNRDFFNYPLISINAEEYGLPQTMMQMIDKYEIIVEKATDWFPIGNPYDLKKAEEIIDKFK